MSISIPSLIGVLITISALSGLLINLCVLMILWKGGLLKSTASSIYLLAFANIFGNCIQESIIAFYVGPMCILQHFLFPGGQKSFGNTIFSFLELAIWYQDMQTTALVAINRVSVIVFPKIGRLFSRKVVKILSFMLFPSGFLLALVSYTIIPCCVPSFYYPDFWQSYVDNGTNYNEHIIDLPQNTLSSLISILCYTTIFIHIHKTYRNIDPNIRKTDAEKRNLKESRYAIQFAVLTVFVLFAWVSFRVFPVVFPNNLNEINPLVTFTVIIHNSANSILFLTINQEVKNCAKKCFGKVSSTQLFSQRLFKIKNKNNIQKKS